MTDNAIAPRTDKEILAIYDKNRTKFQWFINFYFSQDLKQEIIRARCDEDVPQLLNLLNQVWFALPDSQFNIIESPEGWTEFLEVIEE